MRTFMFIGNHATAAAASVAKLQQGLSSTSVAKGYPASAAPLLASYPAGVAAPVYPASTITGRAAAATAPAYPGSTTTRGMGADHDHLLAQKIHLQQQQLLSQTLKAALQQSLQEGGSPTTAPTRPTAPQTIRPEIKTSPKLEPEPEVSPTKPRYTLPELGSLSSDCLRVVDTFDVYKWLLVPLPSPPLRHVFAFYFLKPSLSFPLSSPAPTS